MQNRLLITLSLFWTLSIMSVTAQTYTIKDMSTETLKIRTHSHLYKIKEKIFEKDLKNIEWESDEQWIDLSNDNNGQLSRLRKGQAKNTKRKSILDYLFGWRGTVSRTKPNGGDTEIDSIFVIELRDQITFNIIGISKYPESTIYRAIWKDENINTPLELSEDKESLYLTRDIFGQEEPKPAEFIIEKYELIDNEKEEAEELGTLIVLPVPLE